jgi:hypothetical protein
MRSEEATKIAVERGLFAVGKIDFLITGWYHPERESIA